MSTRANFVRNSERVDLEALKAAHRIEDVVAHYGIELRRQGRAAIGRCPFHPDHGRPNLHVWGDTRSWWCFRCNIGGDVIRFVELAEAVTFREAVERLTVSTGLCRLAAGRTVSQPAPSVLRTAANFEQRDGEELVALQAAASLYHQRLLTDPKGLAYLEQRGLDRPTIETHLIGYSAGDELLPFFRWRQLPLGPALRVGLLDHSGREFMAGRVVIPELRNGHPVWLVGRVLEQRTDSQDATGNGSEPPPKYLALPGSKPLLGAEHVRGSTTVIVVEGVFDLLTLRRWGYPVVALVGTHTRPDIIDQLRAFQRLYLVLDQDDAGLEATLRLADALGPQAVPVALPDGVKDVGELAPRADGQAIFARSLLDAVGMGVAAALDSDNSDVVAESPPRPD
jgi:DNA primase